MKLINSNIISAFSSTIFGDLSNRIAAECGYCQRFSRYTFSKTLWPSDFKNLHHPRSFNCHTCGELSFCGKLSFKTIDYIKHEKDLKYGMLLYDEVGASTQTTIGRFTFKTKKENDEKHAVKDE